MTDAQLEIRLLGAMLRIRMVEEAIAIRYSEQEMRKQKTGSVSHTVRMRFMAGLTGKMRLRWASRSSRILYISSVVERGRREEHELACEEKAT